MAAQKLGRDGERAVGQFLDTHIGADARVFHDVPGVHGNVDHVIICSRGIFAVETKTVTKPRRRSASITVDGDRLTIAGRIPDRNPLAQASVCASGVSQILKDSTGKHFPVKPAVVFPGWFIEDRRVLRSGLWVLEPKALPAWIAREPQVLGDADVALASYHLSRYIRSS